MSKPVLFVLGGPATGKGTVCAAVASEYDFKHISMGDELRAEVARGTELGKKIAEIQARGALVPPDVAVSLLKLAMDGSRCRGFLLDGFPRSHEQKQAWHDQLGSPSGVIFLDCSEETMEQRTLHRIEQAKQSGQVLRADDNIETLRKRFRTNMEQAVPVVEAYKASLGGKCCVLDAAKDRETVAKQVRGFLATLQIAPKA